LKEFHAAEPLVSGAERLLQRREWEENSNDIRDNKQTKSEKISTHRCVNV
jgi:hypothetical protein